LSDERESQELRLDLPAAHSAGRMARQVVGQFASEHGVKGDDIGTLELVSSELLSNAVDHGGGGSDQGGGLPSELAPYLDDSELPDLEDERGRGFFLLMQEVDKLSVAPSEDGKGLEFIARKSLA
jgi:anti-sigma regulatory factor (Ser/Thr protein kinase)